MNSPGLYFSGQVLMQDKPLFSNTGFTALAGKWTCLLGPSGVGKTTILRLFAGTADGAELRGKAAAGDGAPLAGRVALMAQSDMLLPWLSLQDNLMLGARLRGDRSDAALAAATLTKVGLEGLHRRKPGSLSGGQRQRAALARTLIEDRPIVLLDEPFSALDVATRARMQDLTVAALQGRTVLHVTHDPAEAARLADHLLVMTITGVDALQPPPGPAPRAPDAGAVLAATGHLTRLLLEAA